MYLKKNVKNPAKLIRLILIRIRIQKVGLMWIRILSMTVLFLPGMYSLRKNLLGCHGKLLPIYGWFTWKMGDGSGMIFLHHVDRLVPADRVPKKRTQLLSIQISPTGILYFCSEFCCVTRRGHPLLSALLPRELSYPRATFNHGITALLPCAAFKWQLSNPVELSIMEW